MYCNKTVYTFNSDFSQNLQPILQNNNFFDFLAAMAVYNNTIYFGGFGIMKINNFTFHGISKYQIKGNGINNGNFVDIIGVEPSCGIFSFKILIKNKIR